MYSLESSSALTNTTRKFGGKPVPMCLNTSILSESDGCADINSSGKMIQIAIRMARSVNPSKNKVSLKLLECIFEQPEE